MASDTLNVQVNGDLQEHVQRQNGEHGLYDNANEYIRALIRRDLESKEESRTWLQKHLEPALRADENKYVEVSAQDVINRNKAKLSD